MRSYDLRVDVTGKTDLEGELATAATVHLPDTIRGPVPVLFGFPGGGYGRHYYDIATLPGYSQARHHTAHGFIFVACDHLYVGASSQPDPFALTFENLAAANHATSLGVLRALRAGSIAGVDPIEITSVVAMGQSMGGCLLTVQQANHGTYDAVALLGWSAIHTSFPAPDGSRVERDSPPRGTDIAAMADALARSPFTPEQFRYCFHWPDEEPALMEADLATYQPFQGPVRGDASTPWGSSTMPPCAATMMSSGAVAADAARIEVPVFVGCGERDVLPDPWAEPAAYRGSSDISLVVVPRMAHMHNFARTRDQLWDRLEAFARAI